MSRDTYTPKHKYTGNNSLSEYTFDFKINHLDHLLVIVADTEGEELYRVRGSDNNFLSSVEFDPNEGGGTVYLKEILPTNWKLQLVLANDAPIQNFEFRNKTSFRLRSFEDALDLLMGAIQRLTFRAKQALRIHDLDDEDTFNPQLPPKIAEQNGRMIIVNNDGTGFDYGPSIEELQEMSGAPVGGGNTGDFIEKLATGENEWKSADYQGFSQRFGVMWESAGLKDTLDKILNIVYAPPAISLAASPTQSVREKGTVISSVNLTATTTKFSEDILRVSFYRAGLLIHTIDPATPGGGAEVYTSNTPFSDNMTFQARVEDGTSTIGSNIVTYTFVYPYYFGSGALGLTASQVSSLTKDIRTSSANLNKTFTPSNGNVFYFAYPASYGALTSILDENDFETIGDWTLRTESITGLDSNSVSYRIYEFNNPVVAGTTNYTFIR